MTGGIPDIHKFYIFPEITMHIALNFKRKVNKKPLFLSFYLLSLSPPPPLPLHKPPKKVSKSMSFGMRGRAGHSAFSINIKNNSLNTCKKMPQQSVGPQRNKKIWATEHNSSNEICTRASPAKRSRRSGPKNRLPHRTSSQQRDTKIK